MARARTTGAALLLLLAVLGLGAPAANAAGPYPPPSSVSASADPDRVSPGECTTFSGQGFLPGATLEIADNGTSRGTTVAGPDGRFSVQVCFPDDARRGRHVLTATGATSDGTQTASAVVMVVGVSQSAGNGRVQDQAIVDDPLLPRTAAGGGAGGGAGGAAGGGGAGRGFLPFTGVPALLLAVAGTALVGAGALLLVATERRHRRRRRAVAA